MKMLWICKDPESGYYRDDFGGTFVYEDTGKTLAQQFPEQYFQCPAWAVFLLQVTQYLRNKAARLCGKWDQ